MKNRTIAAAGLVALASLTGCSATGTPGPAPAAQTPTSTVDAWSAPSPTPSTSTASAARSTAPHRTTRPDATADLSRFAAAAQHADGELRTADAAVHADLKPGPARVSPATTTAVNAAVAAVDAVEDTIPVGLDRRLLTPVITVDSDLVSRRDAIRVYRYAIEKKDVAPYDAVHELGNGTAAARRFPADLRQVRTRAAGHSPVRPVSRNSTAGVELALYLLDVRMENGCAENNGGVVITRLQTISWTQRPGFGRTARGSFGPNGFSGVFGQNGRWQVEIEAC
jgi:hypothetical protein